MNIDTDIWGTNFCSINKVKINLNEFCYLVYSLNSCIKITNTPGCFLFDEGSLKKMFNLIEDISKNYEYLNVEERQTFKQNIIRSIQLFNRYFQKVGSLILKKIIFNYFRDPLKHLFPHTLYYVYYLSKNFYLLYFLAYYPVIFQNL